MTLPAIRHPFPFDFFKWAGRPLSNRGIPSLTPESLLRASKKAAGVPEFENTTEFSQHLAVATESAEADANLSILGRVGLRGAFVNALSTRLLLEQARRNRPEAFADHVSSPVIVLGMPRSGTTFLHRLLGLDPAARTLPFWQLRRPLVPEGQPDRRLAWARAQSRDFKKLATGIDAKHESTAESPEECLFLFDCSLLSATFWVAGPLYRYIEYYQTQDHLPSYRLYEELLRLFQKERPHERLTLKAPSHTPHVGALRQVLPQAKLVQLHRDPVRAMTSVNSLFYTLHRVVTDELDVGRMARTNLDLATRGLARCLDHRTQHPDHGILDVYYADLVRDPVGTVQHIYDAHGLPFSKDYEIALFEYVRQNPKHKHGVHRYALEDFSLSADEVRERFDGYLRAFPRALEEA